LPIGLLLDEVELIFPDDRVFVCRAQVRHQRAIAHGEATSHRLGLRFEGASEALSAALLDSFLGTRYPAVVGAERLAFPKVWRMLDEAKRSSLDYPAHDGPHVQRLGEAQSALARAHGALGKSVAWVDGGHLVGHANGLRVYSRTWLLQHLAVVPGYRRDAAVSQKLSSLIVEYGESLEDVDFLRYTWFSHVRWTARLSTWVARKIHLPGRSQIKHSHYFRLPPEATCTAKRRLWVRTARPSDLRWLEAQIKAEGDTLGLKSEDLRAEELELASLAERSARVGLERGRTVFVVDGENGPLGFALAEHATPGLCWAEFTNAFRLVIPSPSHPRADEVREALIARAVELYRDLGRDRLFALVAEPHAAALERAGFLGAGQLAEWTFHKSLARSWDLLATAIFERLTTRREDAAADERSAE
jgi:hypothetical protein